MLVLEQLSGEGAWAPYILLLRGTLEATSAGGLDLETLICRGGISPIDPQAISGRQEH